MKLVIESLNKNIECLGIFNKILGLAEKIEKDGAFYPAIYKGSGEYEKIDLDKSGSLSYWRLNGDITFSNEEAKSSVGLEFKKDIPLKFVGYLKKEITSDQYFSGNIADSIISNITSANADVRKELKVRRVSIVATKVVLDPFAVEKSEYETKVDKIRYTDAYFSIDFTLSIFTNNQCYKSICNEC